MSDPQSIDYAAEYDNSARVANANALLDAYVDNAALFRLDPDLDAEFGLAYGRGERQRVDLFWPDTDEGKARKCAIVVFIHGGYWRSMDRSSFSHLARGLLERGIAVAMPSYTLCPDTSVSGIINDLRRACLLLYQTHKRPLTVIGHSAGGHLAACMFATRWQDIHVSLPEDLVASGLGISGIYDLLPMLHTPVNDDIRLDEETAASASPVGWLPDPFHRFDAWVGADESAEYHRQSRTLAARWTMAGTPSLYVSVDGANHFTVVDQLTRSDSPMVERIVTLVSQPADEASLVEPDEATMAAMLDRLEAERSDEPSHKRQDDGDDQ